MEHYWHGQEIPEFCQVGGNSRAVAGEINEHPMRITDRFVDGRVPGHSSWAIMHPSTFERLGGTYGTNYGQLYAKQADGRWLKIEG